MNRHLLVLLPIVLLLLVANYATAGGPCAASCAPCASVQCGGEVQYVEKTIYVPEWVTEVRNVVVCEYNQEQRQRTYTVYNSVPETREVERSCTVLVPEKRVRTVQNRWMAGKIR